MRNNHRIRNNRNAECPGERPDVLYFNHAAGATNYKFPLAGEKSVQALRFCVCPSLINSTEDFLSLAPLITDLSTLMVSPCVTRFHYLSHGLTVG